MKVIGAGLPRTATTTQKLALEILGLGPCYQAVEDAPQSARPSRASSHSGRCSSKFSIRSRARVPSVPGVPDEHCEFLALEVPDEPVPNVNDTEAFRQGIIGGAVTPVQQWWDREQAAVA
jgi:hypothetical protein